MPTTRVSAGTSRSRSFPRHSRATPIASRASRLPLRGGPETEITLQKPYALNFYIGLGSQAIRRGRLLANVVSADSTFDGSALVDLATGRVTRWRFDPGWDLYMPGWTGEDQVTGFAASEPSELWRFRARPRTD